MIYIEEKQPEKVPGLTSLFITFDFKKEIVDILKTCTPCNYSEKTNIWEIPLTRLSKFINQAYKYDNIDLKLIEENSNKTDVYTEKDLGVYKTVPYPYQKEGILYGLNHKGWLLLDQPGLGKTLQMICLAQELKEKEGVEHCLIICGINTLKSNWEKEISKHSDLSCRVLGKRINKKGNITYASVAERIKELSSPIDEFFVILNIETLRSNDVIKKLRSGKNKFDMMVVDEIHAAKTPTSQQGRNLLKLTNAKFKIGLTGTPILNSPFDAYMPLKWTGNDSSTYGNFKAQYCVYGGPFNNEIIGYKNLDMLSEQIESCSLRRTKDLLNLPEKTVIDEVLDMAPDHQLLYSNICEGIVDQVDKVKLSVTNLLAMVTRLRQATACPAILTTENITATKIDRCVELCDEIISNHNKVVVFSVFKDPLNELYKRLSNYKPLLCTGDVADDIISQNIDKFQESNENSVILCTTSKMGTGITLTAASYAIFIDTPWTQGVTQQCEDRIHRIGSGSPVFIYRLWCNNSIDMRVKKILENKEAIGDYIVDNVRDQKTLDILKEMITDLS